MSRLLAIALCTAIAFAQSPTPAEALHEKGLTLFEKADYNGAREALLESLRLHEKARLREEQAINLRALALVHDAIGERQKALGFYDRALNIARAIRNAQLEARTLRDIGVLYYNLDDNARAFPFLEQALALQRKNNNPKALAETLFSIGEMRRYFKQFTEARRCFEEALPLARATQNQKNEADILSSLAALDIRHGRPLIEKALAIRIAMKDVRGEASTRLKLGLNYQSNQIAGAAIEEFRKAAAMFASVKYSGGEAFARQSLAIVQLSQGNRDTAISEMSKAVDLAESLRQRLSDRDLRATYIGYVQNRYEFLIDACIDKKDIAAAFHWSERARARALVETLHDAGARTAPAKPPPSLQDIQASLDQDTTILEYALGDYRSHLFTISRQGIGHHTLPGRDALEMWARSAYEKFRNPKAAPPDSNQLAAILTIREIRSRKLIVVADGALQYVPFAALTAAEVTLAPSISTIFGIRADRRRATTSNAPRIAVFADPVTNTHARLAFSKLEAETILKLLPTAEPRTKATGADVTRNAVTTAANARILHFATHGVLDSVRPERTEIILSGGDSLRLRDIQAMNLAADLVVLSACETALGKEMKREGLMGLTNAFQLAGADRVLSTLWKVDDRATAELMKHFYTAMFQQSKPPAAALQFAQSTLAKSKRWSHPFYWAGFVLQGEWR